MNRQICLQEKKDWGSNAQFYKNEANSPFQKRLTKIKLEVYSIGEADKFILDLGAGAGHVSDEIQRGDRKVIALDFVFKMSEVARQCYPDLIYIIASADKLPFKEKSFDVIIADGLFHHLKVQGLLQGSLQEIRRVLKKRGKLCIFDRNGSFFSNTLLMVFMQLNKILRFIKGRYPSSSTRNELLFNERDLQLIKNSGFKILNCKHVSSLPFYLSIVLTNVIQYVFGSEIAIKIRKKIFPIAYWFEKRIKSKMLTVEQCIKLERIESNDEPEE